MNISVAPLLTHFFESNTCARSFQAKVLTRSCQWPLANLSEAMMPQTITLQYFHHDKNAAHAWAASCKVVSTFWKSVNPRLTLGELARSSCFFESVLKFFDCRFSLIFRAFLPFRVSVVLFLNHKNRCFFNQKPSDVAHHLPHQKAPLVYCTSLLHRCP